MNKPKFLPYFEIIFAVLTWGASFVATKIALRYAQPVTVVWLRFAIGVLVLGAAVLLRKQFAMPSQKDLAYFALLGFLGITFHQWLQSTGLVTAQATTTAWIIATTPIFIALLGWLILKETMVWGQIAGILLATLGVLLVVTRGDFSTFTSGHFGAPGDFLILISAPNWAVFSVISRQGVQKYPPTRMMFFVMLLGWLFSTVLFAAGRGYQDIARIAMPGWLGVAFLGIF
ncbi:MAG: DMT family transporter, partial [Omnitrophica WOR_2 bacterium]